MQISCWSTFVGTKLYTSLTKRRHWRLSKLDHCSYQNRQNTVQKRNLYHIDPPFFDRFSVPYSSPNIGLAMDGVGTPRVYRTHFGYTDRGVGDECTRSCITTPWQCEISNWARRLTCEKMVICRELGDDFIKKR